VLNSESAIYITYELKNGQLEEKRISIVDESHFRSLLILWWFREGVRDW